jgi:hypothetical protein
MPCPLNIEMFLARVDAVTILGPFARRSSGGRLLCRLPISELAESYLQRTANSEYTACSWRACWETAA